MRRHTSPHRQRGSDQTSRDTRPAPTHALTRDEGFTLVEVLVAIFILLVGVMGAVEMVNAANRTTSVTRARESAVNLARAVVESARSLPYSSLSQSLAPSAIQALPGLADSDATAPGWQVARRGITYTVNFSACAVDDPSDGIGTDTSDFCQQLSPTNPPDTKPDDYRRVSVSVSWNDSSGPQYTKQSTVIAGNYRGPSILTLTGPTNVITDSATNPLYESFNVTASAGTDHVNWSLDGNDQGLAMGCGTFCPISWNLGKPTGSAPCDPNGGGVVDGTYIVQATAYDATALSGNPRAVTVQLNRCPPLPPTGLEAGLTKKPGDQLKALFPGVELLWDGSPEEDVVGYHVYKSTTAAGTPPVYNWQPIAANTNPDPTQPGCDGLVKTPNCVDADTTTKVWYAVAAVDKDPNGNLREGALSPAVLVDPANSKPPAPGGPGFNVDASQPYSITWPGQAISDPPPADYTDFFYVYRDSIGGRVDRYDSISNAGGPISWTDPDPNGQAHYYWVTAVDNHLAESDPAPGFPPGHYIYCDATGTCTKK